MISFFSAELLLLVLGARLRVVQTCAKSFILVVLSAKSAVFAGGGGGGGGFLDGGVSFLLVFSLDHFLSPFA